MATRMSRATSIERFSHFHSNNQEYSAIDFVQGPRSPEPSEGVAFSGLTPSSSGWSVEVGAVLLERVDPEVDSQMEIESVLSAVADSPLSSPSVIKW